MLLVLKYNFPRPSPTWSETEALINRPGNCGFIVMSITSESECGRINFYWRESTLQRSAVKVWTSYLPLRHLYILYTHLSINEPLPRCLHIYHLTVKRLFGLIIYKKTIWLHVKKSIKSFIYGIAPHERFRSVLSTVSLQYRQFWRQVTKNRLFS